MVQRTKGTVRRGGIARLVIGVPRTTIHFVKESALLARRAGCVLAARAVARYRRTVGGLRAPFAGWARIGPVFKERDSHPSQVAPRQTYLLRLLH